MMDAIPYRFPLEDGLVPIEFLASTPPHGEQFVPAITSPDEICDSKAAETYPGQFLNFIAQTFVRCIACG